MEVKSLKIQQLLRVHNANHNFYTCSHNYVLTAKQNHALIMRSEEILAYLPALYFSVRILLKPLNYLM